MSSGLDCAECGDCLDIERYYPHGICDRCEDIYRAEREDERDDDSDEDYD
jgi:hypothetical protein